MAAIGTDPGLALLVLIVVSVLPVSSGVGRTVRTSSSTAVPRRTAVVPQRRIWAVMLVLAIAVGGANWANLAAGFIGSVTVLIGGYAILALALNLQWGYTGLFNIGIAGFMAVGAYTTAVRTAPTDPAAGAVPGLGLPLWVGLIGGMDGRYHRRSRGATSAPSEGRLPRYRDGRVLGDHPTRRQLERARQVSLFGVPFGTGGATGISFKSANEVASTLINGVGQPLVTAAEGVGVSGPSGEPTYGILLLLVVAAATSRSSASSTRRSVASSSPSARTRNALAPSATTRSATNSGVHDRLCADGAGRRSVRGQAGYDMPTARSEPRSRSTCSRRQSSAATASNTGSVIGAATFSGLLFYLPDRLGENVSRAALAHLATSLTLAGLGSLDPLSLLASTISNVSTLRFVLIGVVLYTSSEPARRTSRPPKRTRNEREP